MSKLEFLTTLEAVINERLSSGTVDSYTASLAASGTNRVAQKVGEEALELAIASVAGSRGEILDEGADLVYHLLVLLATQKLSLGEVVATLENRHTG